MELWNSVQEELKRTIDSSSYQSWFGNIEVEQRQGLLILWAPSLFHKDWIDNHYKEDISKFARKRIGSPIKVKVMCRQVGTKRSTKNRTLRGIRNRIAVQSRSAGSDFLNPLYSFDNFVVGTSNQFAHAASLSVAEAPNRVYNPLFIYGGVGLGKTHLMQAIGNKILSDNPEAKIIYLSAEQFTNEFINSLRDGRIDAFQKKFRSAELLLIDDIQFLANKERSQEEFFHTFNELYESQRQIVISSDRPPREIPTVEDRLRNRLEWGLIADIQPPDLETRIAILRKKAAEGDIDIPNDCVEFITQHFRSNIRELEGALMRVSAMASFQSRVIDIELTKEALRDLTEIHHDKHIGVDQIQKAVSAYFKVTPQELKGKRRSSDITLPRQVAMFLCRQITGLSLPVIGSEFGGRDHTTVLHSCRKIGSLIERDRRIQSIINDVKTTLLSE